MRSNRLRIVVLLLLGGGAGVWVGLRVDEALRVTPVPESHAAAPPAPGPAAPLALRLVDTGGVGISGRDEDWGHDYSHNTRTFHDLILEAPPYVDEREYGRVRDDWNRYLDRMRSYGNNGVVVPVFLELVTFDGLGPGELVYGPASPYRARHLAVRERFRALFEDARARGFLVFLKTDMFALTEPLARHLRRLPRGLDASSPEVWSTYGAGLEEVFAALPEVEGVVVRVGEAGPLFNRTGWPYWSEFGVNDRAGLRAMLRGLLPVFERHRKSLVLRSWSVGPGEIGGMHTDPAVYQATLGDIDSPSLIVSTKYVQGDFFSFLPPNPTLAAGPQRRIVELQARPEFEGFGAFPNYVAVPHQRALRELLARNPRIVGTWTWTQDGGPLRAGPRSLYPLHGFWHWIDANVHASSRLAADPAADLDAVAREWVAREVADDPDVVAALSGVLLGSRRAVETGFYIRPFAERRLHIGPIDVPPLLWIAEWDVIGGWSAVMSTIYLSVRSDLERTASEGFAAARIATEGRRALEGVEERLRRRPDLYRSLHRSLQYEESLLETLAWHRRAFLEYYRWLDSGDGRAHERFLESAEAFRRARRDHRARFQDDLDFPAFDFGPADRALRLAQRGPAVAWLARLQLAVVTAVLVFGSRRGARWGGFPAVLAVHAALALAIASAFSFASWRLPLLVLLLLTVFSATLALAWRALGHRASPLPATLVPLLAATLVLLAGMCERGPLHLWFRFWSGGAFRVAIVALLVACLGGMLYAALAAGRAVTGRLLTAAACELGALGVTLLVATSLLPATRQTLGALHEPLAQLPMTFAVVQGIVTYVGVPPSPALYSAVAGLVLLSGGAALAGVGARRDQ